MRLQHEGLRSQIRELQAKVARQRAAGHEAAARIAELEADNGRMSRCIRSIERSTEWRHVNEALQELDEQEKEGQPAWQKTVDAALVPESKQILRNWAHDLEETVGHAEWTAKIEELGIALAKLLDEARFGAAQRSGEALSPRAWKDLSDEERLRAAVPFRMDVQTALQGLGAYSVSNERMIAFLVAKHVHESNRSRLNEARANIGAGGGDEGDDSLIQLRRSVRDLALEEAATICEKGVEDLKGCGYDSCAKTARENAELIRALKSEPPRTDKASPDLVSVASEILAMHRRLIAESGGHYGLRPFAGPADGLGGGSHLWEDLDHALAGRPIPPVKTIFPYELDTDDVCFLEEDVALVFGSISPNLEGLRMTRETARELGRRLLGIASATATEADEEEDDDTSETGGDT